MYHYQFTRTVHGVHWTATVTPTEVRFEKGITHSWMQDQNISWYERYSDTYICSRASRIDRLRYVAMQFACLQRAVGRAYLGDKRLRRAA